MGAICWALLKGAVPTLDVGHIRPRHVDVEVTEQVCPCRNVGKRELTAEQEPAVGKDSVEQLEMLRAAADFIVDRGHVPLSRWRAVIPPKDANQVIRLQSALRPIHPSVGQRALSWIVVPQSSRAVTGGDITQYRMGLPNDSAVVVDNGYSTVWVHGAELWCIDPAERTSQFNVAMLYTEFAYEPHHLLNVEGAFSSEDREHGSSLLEV